MINHRSNVVSLCILIAAFGCGSHRTPEPSVAAQAPVGEQQTALDEGESLQTQAPETQAPRFEPEMRVDLDAPAERRGLAAAGPALSPPPPAAPGAPLSALSQPLAAPKASAGAPQRLGAKPAKESAARLQVAEKKKDLEPSPLQASVGDLANTEAYNHISDNPFLAVGEQPLSTFSIDVDTASYSNLRRMLNEGQTVPQGAVRIEEMVNYFSYDYPDPTAAEPFSVNSEVAPAPWNDKHQLVRIGLQGKRIAPKELPPRNLVFLIDVSGSMAEANKLPLLTRSLAALTETLSERDHVALVVYAGASGVVLEPTAGNQKQTIHAALSRLQAGGSTNGASGIELAYATASRFFEADGVNRVVLATDGDFNVGPSSQDELVRIIEAKRKTGVYLTVLGFGMGNYKDAALEQLADHGNGNYAYIDSFDEASKVLVEEGGSTLVTIAKDVKIQVEFNPRLVGAYRLIGYENRKLENRDFHDDSKDAGEIGAGHSVTALYELVPPGAVKDLPRTEALKYQTPATPKANETELLTVKLRYKAPREETSQLLSVAVTQPKAVSQGSEDFRFAAAVAAFGMVLRQSEHKAAANLDLVDRLARGALGADRNGRRKELLELVRLARKQLPSEQPAAALTIAR